MPLDDFLRRAVLRVRMRDGLRGVGAAAAVAGILLVLLRVAGTSDTTAAVVALLLFGAGTSIAITWIARTRTRRAVAALVERSDPSLRNLLVTAEQLLAQPDMSRAPMRDRVLAGASRRTAAIDLRRSVPVGRDVALALLGVAMFVFSPAVRVPAGAASQIVKLPNSHISQRRSASITVTLTPPGYTGRSMSTLKDPPSIDVLAGTHGTFAFGGLQGVRMRVNGTPVQGVVTFVESGFVAIDGGGLDRIVPVTVIPDRAPDVRITAPAKDLRVATTGMSIPISVEASDDLALQALELRYTIVSGTGEQFSFTEGTLPATVTRGRDTSWKLEAPLSLAKLKLEPGDALIYRAVAADKRPGGAGIASSDTFFVEVAGPGDVPLDGVEMPPDRERYALSQAMIVLKLERLQARERSLARDALIEAAGTIAAEQRAVRANFIFLLGGEIEDEEVEAAQEHEVTEGRLANQARREISNAIALMGRVEKGLAAASTATALPPAREAVKALQRAFGHSRYLLRALPSRARIDPARRLSGDTSTASDWSRALAAPAPDPVAESARSAMNELAQVSVEIVRLQAEATGNAGQNAATPQAGNGQLVARLDAVAERLLLGSNAELQAAARDVLAARDALSDGRVNDARATLKKAAGPLVKLAQRGRIDGAWIAPDAARAAGAAAISRGGVRR